MQTSPVIARKGHSTGTQMARPLSAGRCPRNHLVDRSAGTVRTALARRHPHRDQFNHVLGLRSARHADRLTVAAHDDRERRIGQPCRPVLLAGIHPVGVAGTERSRGVGERGRPHLAELAPALGTDPDRCLTQRVADRATRAHLHRHPPNVVGRGDPHCLPHLQSGPRTGSDARNGGRHPCNLHAQPHGRSRGAPASAATTTGRVGTAKR